MIGRPILVKGQVPNGRHIMACEPLRDQWFTMENISPYDASISRSIETQVSVAADVTGVEP